jgi:large subunit ribosomal protein L31e
LAKKDEKSKAKQVLERTYNIPLRREFLKVANYRRAKKAIASLRKFLERHMKGTPVKIGPHLNEKIWERGIKNPPHHVKVTAIKYDDGSVKAELSGFPVEPEKKEAKKKAKEGKKDVKTAAEKKEAEPKEEKIAKEAKAAEAKESTEPLRKADEGKTK